MTNPISRLARPRFTRPGTTRLLALPLLMLLPMIGMTACQTESADCFEAVEAHFPQREWSTAKAIVWRESRNIPTAQNPRSSAKGCFQLMHSLHSWRYNAVSCGDWSDPDCSALAAKHLKQASGGWGPWGF